eukprot:364940-Chlamydomonas_euryale.AAC.6
MQHLMQRMQRMAFHCQRCGLSCRVSSRQPLIYLLTRRMGIQISIACVTPKSLNERDSVVSRPRAQNPLTYIVAHLGKSQEQGVDGAGRHEGGREGCMRHEGGWEA